MKNIAIKAALAASKILKENFGRITSTQIDLKRQFDFVTFVDKSSEQEIIRIIREQYPDHKFYAEESDKDESGGYRWIIDPLDGTTNYIHGFPAFSISIALEYNKEIILGVIYDPMREELFVAEKGKGATLNDKTIRVSDIADPALSLLTTGFPFRAKNYLELYQESFRQLFLKMSGIRRIGSVALDFSYLACGRCEGFWEIGLSPWDIAAGYLIIREAGGLMTDFAGEDCPVWTGNVVASNGHLHEAIIRVVKDVFAGTIDK
ncbi:inositol monophosphatase [candidate division KSB1 bacterium]|nr:inositol monophosphatase [candidate division KSB1 bacterium]